MNRPTRLLAFTGFVGLMAIAVLSVCSDSRPIATETPEATEAPSATSAAPPTATSAPAPASTPMPAPTAAPTQAPTSAPTTAPEMPSVPSIEIGPGTTWGDLFGALSPQEQACISSELGDQAAAVSEMNVLSATETQPWQMAVFDCLSQETASEIFLASFDAQFPDLTEEDLSCVRGLLSGADILALMGSQAAEPDPAAEAAALQFGFGLLTCLPPEMLTAFLEGDGTNGTGGDGGPSAPPPTDEALLWWFSTDDWVVNAPAVADGVVYAGSDDHSVYALDAASGQLIWSYKTSGFIRSTPTVADGVVYVGSSDSHVYALDAGSGGLIWRFNTGNAVQYSPVVSEGRVFVVAAGDTLYSVHALDAGSGETLWAAQVAYPYGAALAVTAANGRVYTPGESGEFYALDASTGNVDWSVDVGLGAESPPAVVDGVVYLTAVNNAYALDEATGNLIWNYGTEMFPAMDRPAVVDDGVYYFAPDNNLYAMNTETGHFAWYYVAEDFIVDTPLAADGMVYLSMESGIFDAIDATTGAFVWRWEMPDTALRSARVFNGVLIAESSDGYLRALNAATGEMLWSYSKGYFDGVPSFTVDGSVLYVGSLDGSIYAFAFPGAG